MSWVKAVILWGSCLLVQCAEPVSQAPSSSRTAGGSSWGGIISPNGRYAAFLSGANNLVTNKDDRTLGLFVQDLASGANRLISSGLGDASYPSFSSDARFLAFAAETGGVSHIFLYDQQTGGLSCLTTDSVANPNSPPPVGSFRPILTVGGAKVLFESSATNLTSEPDTNNVPDLFLHDLQSGSNILISVGAAARPGTFPRQKLEAAMTPNGERVAFVTRNVSAPTTNTAVRSELFVRDLSAGASYWASANVESLLNSGIGAYVCANPALSSNGNLVVFKVLLANNSSNAFVLRHDLQSSQTTLIASNSRLYTAMAISSNGRHLMYDAGGQVYRYDHQTGSNELVSVSAVGTNPASGDSQLATATPDAAVAAFVSSASDLTAAGNASMKYQLYVRDLASATTRLVSINTNQQPATASMFGAEAALETSGQKIVFAYGGNDLVHQDFNDASDVFMSDVASDEPVLLSRALTERSALTSPGGAGADLNAVSSDGSKVLFTAYDIPSYAGDVNRQRDVFLVDMSTSGISLVSAGDHLDQARGGEGLISGDGRYALYFREMVSPGQVISGSLHLFRRDLVSNATEEIDPESSFPTHLSRRRMFVPALSHDGSIVVYSKSRHLYLKDMVAGTNQLIAQSRFALRSDEEMIHPQLSPDLRWVLFHHRLSGDITTNTFNPGYNLFARDLSGTSIILVSADQNGVGLGTVTTKSMSASGQSVAYDVWPGSQLPLRTNIYLFDFASRANTLICSNCSDPSVSADGRLVAFAGRRVGSSIDDIYIKDLTLDTVARIGENLANGSSGRPLLSADGRYVVFTSKASSYVADDDNGVEDVFVHDRYHGATYRLSAGNRPSSRPIVSQNGRTVVFQSLANDLSPGDYNEALDIFAATLGAGDSDNDGMDDAWEVTYFNDVGRNGLSDLDGDGHSDLQEFIAGTDPTNAGSVLEVIAIRSLTPNQVRILWSGTVGKRYVIQTKESLNSPSWSTVSDPIPADTTAMSWDLASAVPTAFYRVVLVH